jgi:hypothetical protein
MALEQDARYDADPAQAYLRSSAAFFAGNVAEAVRRLDVRDGMRVLDAGTGAGVAVRLTPGGPRYVVDEPGYYVVHPALVAAGRRR